MRCFLTSFQISERQVSTIINDYENYGLDRREVISAAQTRFVSPHKNSQSKYNKLKRG